MVCVLYNDAACTSSILNTILEGLLALQNLMTVYGCASSFLLFFLSTEPRSQDEFSTRTLTRTLTNSSRQKIGLRYCQPVLRCLTPCSGFNPQFQASCDLGSVFCVLFIHYLLIPSPYSLLILSLQFLFGNIPIHDHILYISIFLCFIFVMV
jgi:hypothetical protein